MFRRKNQGESGLYNYFISIYLDFLRSKQWLYLGIFLIYFLLPIFSIYTTNIFNFNNEMFKSGDASYLAFQSFTAFEDFSLTNFFKESKSIFYPDKYFYFYDGSLIPIFFYRLFFLLSKNYVFAYNIMIPFFLGIAGLSAYFLSWHFTNNRSASFIAGLFYSFNPVSLNQYWAKELYPYSLLPLLFLLLYKYIYEPTKKNLTVFGLVLTLIGLASLQMWAFALIFVSLLFIVFHGKNFLSNRLLRLVISILVSVTILLPLIAYHYYFSSRYAISRSIYDLISSSNKLEYLPQAIFPHCESYLYSFLQNKGISFSCLSLSHFYIGIAWSGLAFFACIALAILFMYKLKLEKVKFLSRKLLLLMILVFYFSCGPVIKFYNWQLPTPYSLLYYHTPFFDFFRVPARFLLFNYLLWSLLIGISINVLKRLKFYLTICIFLAILYIIEVVFPFKSGFHIQSGLTQPVWNNLGKKEAAIFVKYPIPWYGGNGEGDPDSNTELFEYFVHRKPTLWGYPGVISYASRELLNYLSSDTLPTLEKLEILSMLNVTYLVIDQQFISSIPDEIIKNELKSEYADSQHQLFKIKTIALKSATSDSLSFSCTIGKVDVKEKYQQLYIQIENLSDNHWVQHQPYVRAQYHHAYNGQVDKEKTAWMQVPFVVPAHSTLLAELTIPKLTPNKNNLTLSTNSDVMSFSVICK